MTSTAVALIAFGCTSLGALTGLLLHARLPAHHLDANSRDVIKLVMGLIATVAALVLGLLISSAHRAYDTQESEIQQLGIHLFQLDRALKNFGPEADDARRLLRSIVASEVESVSSSKGIAVDKPLEAQREVAELFQRIAGLAPRNDAQKFMQGQALRLLATLGDTRLLLNEQARSSISWPFFAVLVFWLTVLLVGFGLFARINTTLVSALFLGAVSVAGAIFLILELNRPHGGVMRISIEPIRNALTHMNR